jgi:hypothetical protein
MNILPLAPMEELIAKTMIGRVELPIDKADTHARDGETPQREEPQVTLQRAARPKHDRQVARRKLPAVDVVQVVGHGRLDVAENHARAPRPFGCGRELADFFELVQKVNFSVRPGGLRNQLGALRARRHTREVVAALTQHPVDIVGPDEPRRDAQLTDQIA